MYFMGLHLSKYVHPKVHLFTDEYLHLSQNFINILLLLPLAALIILSTFAIEENFNFLALIFSLLIFIYTCLAIFQLELDLIGPQFKTSLMSLSFSSCFFSIFNNLIEYSWGFDSLSLVFICLTALLLFISLLINWSLIDYFTKEFIVVLFFLEFIIFNIFACWNLMLFYIFFESVLIPMFLMVGIWGSRKRKVHASYQFFLYTFFGSVFMLFSIFWLYHFTYSVNFLTLFYLTHIKLCFWIYESFIWFALFFSFAVKVPMVPLHIWLPEAHVEAPTTGSVLLAGILLKLGTYAMIRILITFFLGLTYYNSSLLFTICLAGIVYSGVVTIRQIDLKKIIAYSSIVHMNFSLLGLFSLNLFSIVGSIFLMLSHGLVSGGLFFAIGSLYDRYKTRILKYYGGLAQTMPLFTVSLFILTFANIGLPGTSSFPGEILTLIGIIYNDYYLIAVLSTFSILLGSAYALWLYNRLVYYRMQFIANWDNKSVVRFPLNQTKIKEKMILFKNSVKFPNTQISDLTLKESSILFIFLFAIIFFGIYPAYILEKLEDVVKLLLIDIDLSFFEISYAFDVVDEEGNKQILFEKTRIQDYPQIYDMYRSNFVLAYEPSTFWKEGTENTVKVNIGKVGAGNLEVEVLVPRLTHKFRSADLNDPPWPYLYPEYDKWNNMTSNSEAPYRYPVYGLYYKCDSNISNSEGLLNPENPYQKSAPGGGVAKWIRSKAGLAIYNDWLGANYLHQFLNPITTYVYNPCDLATPHWYVVHMDYDNRTITKIYKFSHPPCEHNLTVHMLEAIVEKYENTINEILKSNNLTRKQYMAMPEEEAVKIARHDLVRYYDVEVTTNSDQLHRDHFILHAMLGWPWGGGKNLVASDPRLDKYFLDYNTRIIPRLIWKRTPYGLYGGTKWIPDADGDYDVRNNIENKLELEIMEPSINEIKFTSHIHKIPKKVLWSDPTIQSNIVFDDNKWWHRVAARIGDSSQYQLIDLEVQETEDGLLDLQKPPGENGRLTVVEVESKEIEENNLVGLKDLCLDKAEVIYRAPIKAKHLYTPEAIKESIRNIAKKNNGHCVVFAPHEVPNLTSDIYELVDIALADEEKSVEIDKKYGFTEKHMEEFKKKHKLDEYAISFKENYAAFENIIEKNETKLKVIEKVLVEMDKEMDKLEEKMKASIANKEMNLDKERKVEVVEETDEEKLISPIKDLMEKYIVEVVEEHKVAKNKK